MYRLAPVPLDAGLLDVLDRAAEAEGASSVRMPSGAGHDAMVLAPHVPAAMLFVPSRGGVSHSPAELHDRRALRARGPGPRGRPQGAARGRGLVLVVGVDIGGTFTDLMLYDTDAGGVHLHKVRSSPEAPERAMVEGLLELCAQAGAEPSAIGGVFHGTTVATNAVLTHDGALAGMVTNRGFRDVVHIGRHQRPQHYSIMQDIPWQASPFVRRRHRKVVGGRIAPPLGEELEPLDEAGVRAVARELREAGVEAVAVCFLFSYLDPAHERRAAAIVAEELPDAFVTASADIFPQFREFERFTTACMNAFVGPKTGRYLERLAGALSERGVPGDLHVMMSNGGVARAEGAAERPVTLMLSGPAAGVLGGQWAGDRSGRRRLITFDMGGTSADIGIVTEAGVMEASARDTEVAGYPLSCR